jgi:hypothetical protein
MRVKQATTKVENNKLNVEDRAVHDWYRFVLSFPPHLVRDYLVRFNADTQSCVLDPFCGTGTTLVECKKLGIPSVGVEALPVAHFASETKTDWSVDPDGLWQHANEIANITLEKLQKQGINNYCNLPLFNVIPEKEVTNLRGLPTESAKLLIKSSISPLPMHKTLELLDTLESQRDGRYYQHERLALAKALVFRISNLHFGPEVGVRRLKSDAPVVSAWLNCVLQIVDDLRVLNNGASTKTTVYNADSRTIKHILKPQSVDVVITSPPYPNEKDYTRITRLESVILGFFNNRKELRKLKKNLIRSNTRGVYRTDSDDTLVVNHPEVQRIAKSIEKRRKELGKTSGFERMYARVTKLYFGGILQHLSELRTVLRPGARLAYVVGDQASYLRVMIRTGQLVADIAESLGYKVVGIDLFRTRLATVTKKQLREEIVILRWP